MDDDREALIMRQEDELHDDVQVVNEYGRSNPGVYGGVRFDNEQLPGPVRLVVSFTRDLDRHAKVLRSLVRHPDRVDVRSCLFSEQECLAMADRVTQRIIAATPEVGSLAVLPSIWSGTTVLVDGDDLEAVRNLLRDEPSVTVGQGGYRPLTDHG